MLAHDPRTVDGNLSKDFYDADGTRQGTAMKRQHRTRMAIVGAVTIVGGRYVRVSAFADRVDRAAG
jgi:hypothetical protein